MAFLRRTNAGRTSDGANVGGSGVELSIGLSLNGRFGVDPAKIPRSATVSAFSPVGVDGGDSSSQFPAAAAAEVERYRMLKEIQATNRLVARKRRFDKFISRQLGKGEDSDETNSSHEPAVNGGGDGHGDGTNDAPPRSVRTKAGGSSATKADRGNERSAQVAQGDSKNKPKAQRPLIPQPRAAEKIEPVEMRMPSVTTNGPNGRRVEGILYSYARPEMVTIMCVCHGYFMSPAQFIEHAGGQVVENGFKQITVNLPQFVS